MSTINWADRLSLKSVGKVYHNLDYQELYEHEKTNNEVVDTSSGAVNVDTGKFTGRSPKDKYFVKREPSSKYISWGKINQPVSEEIFDSLFEKVKNHLDGKDLYITELYCGSNVKTRKQVRFISQLAWQAHFVTNMFIRPTSEQLQSFSPQFTVYNACQVINDEWEKHGLNSEVFVVFDIERNIAIIGGTYYGGEMKKGIFTMMNYWLPLENIMTMHCSANVGKDGDTALFFGLSGTGKTTLSTDPHRKLIGDDEHGWDDDGIFNFEGGCYAKTINLDPKSEPEIFEAIRKNALLENVVINSNCIVDYKDDSKTENTRVSYPIFHIENHQSSLKGGHPDKIIFLSYDAFGVLPPVSKLTKEQAMYYFLSGYTAKVAGTERGVTEPVATFSSCFGEAFLPLHPTKYAKLLGEKIQKHDVDVYLVNTGITGGPYGVGKRMSIKNTRICINAILDGSIKKTNFNNMPVFNIAIPESIDGVDNSVLNPRESWLDKDAYDDQVETLAKLFIGNFKKFITDKSDFSGAGPKVD